MRYLKCFQWNFVMPQIPLLLVTFWTKHLVWFLKHCILGFLNPVVVLSWKTRPCKQHGAVSVWRRWSCQWKVVLQHAVKTQTWAVGGYLILRHRVLKHTFMYYHPCVHVSILCHIQIYTVYEQSYWIGTILSRYVGYGIGHDIHSIYYCRYKTYYNYKRQQGETIPDFSKRSSYDDNHDDHHDPDADNYKLHSDHTNLPKCEYVWNCSMIVWSWKKNAIDHR